MTRSIRLMAAGLALVAAVAPVAAQASHCTPGIIVFSGVDTGLNDHNGVPLRPGPNGALAACAVDPNDESLPVIWPGATHMVVAYTLGSFTAPTGTLEFNGQVTDLTFTFQQPAYATSPRWESQSVPTQVGQGPVTVTVSIDGEEYATVTYNKYV